MWLQLKNKAIVIIFVFTAIFVIFDGMSAIFMIQLSSVLFIALS